MRRLEGEHLPAFAHCRLGGGEPCAAARGDHELRGLVGNDAAVAARIENLALDRKSTRLNSSHVRNSYAVFCSKKKINADLYLLWNLACVHISVPIIYPFKLCNVRNLLKHAGFVGTKHDEEWLRCRHNRPNNIA